MTVISRYRGVVVAAAIWFGLAFVSVQADAQSAVPPAALAAQSSMPQPSEADVLKIENADLASGENQARTLAAYWKSVADKMQVEHVEQAKRLQVYQDYVAAEHKVMRQGENGKLTIEPVEQPKPVAAKQVGQPAPAASVIVGKTPLK